ncbi:hypothetical protein [Arthrobacter mobilis]|uniref:Uncharacterized protein n=1 Tax=Arthrobacter mobilis TaxID=2724944 RepID=A0A7X6K5Y9_9MICC|nr:hypothetical protein [Arthrobacter mobilis]NKX56290.1 hypothetical protein [Arthrobacter mobilis]
MTADLPFMQDVASNVAWFQESPASLTEGVLRRATAHVGRNHTPALLAELLWADMLTEGLATTFVAEAWSDAEYPEMVLDSETWRDLFDLAGYTVDGKRSRRPAGLLRLYRGSAEEFRERMSWTDDLAIARAYAGGFARRQIGHIWTASVPAHALLARNTGRAESEYVVDTDMIDIEHLENGRPIGDTNPLPPCLAPNMHDVIAALSAETGLLK